MEILTSTGRVGESDVQALAVPVFKDEKAHEGFLSELDEAAGGLVKAVIEAEEIKGKEGETAYLLLPEATGLKARRVLLVGVGERDSYGLGQVSQMAGAAVRALRARNVKTIGLVLRGAAEPDARAASSAVEGAVMSL